MNVAWLLICGVVWFSEIKRLHSFQLCKKYICIQPSPVFRSPVTVIAENLVSLLQKMAHPHRHTNKKRGSVDFTDVYEGSDLSFVTAVDYLDGPSFSKSSD